MILINTVKVIGISVPRADDPAIQFLEYLAGHKWQKCRFFVICKLTTDPSGGFYQLASMFDFKYHLVQLKLMHSVAHHQAAQNSMVCFMGFGRVSSQ